MSHPAVRARNFLWATFFVMGISSMAWVPRIPEIKDQLGLRDGQFGFVFLAGAFGSVVGTQISGRAIHLIASRDRKSTRLNSSHIPLSRMPSSA